MQTVKPEHGDGLNEVEQNPIPVKMINHVARVPPMLSWVGIKKNIMVNKLLLAFKSYAKLFTIIFII